MPTFLAFQGLNAAQISRIHPSYTRTVRTLPTTGLPNYNLRVKLRQILRVIMTQVRKIRDVEQWAANRFIFRVGKLQLHIYPCGQTFTTE
jgi:hypothetical protein